MKKEDFFFNLLFYMVQLVTNDSQFLKAGPLMELLNKLGMTHIVDW